MPVDECVSCSAQVGSGDRFCEACGHKLAEPIADRTHAVAAAGTWVSSANTPDTCTGCGASDYGREGYCDQCGRRRVTAKDHTELELGGQAAVTDKGHRHHRNEDAVGLALLQSAVAAVVCDGVSTSTRPDDASNKAVMAALAALVPALDRRTPADEAIHTAARAAQAAATLAAGPEPGANPPACTFVCAVIEPEAVTIGWVGDSRAYWLPDADGGPKCLTVDDSTAGQFAAQGLPVPSHIPPDQAVALMRWFGADATDTAPHLYRFAPAGPGRVLVCSDGLFRYRPAAADLAASTPNDPPLATAQALVRLALDAGGQDNIAVAVLTYPPGTPTT
jgi:serine/threonine protein phosphatase PrpC